MKEVTTRFDLKDSKSQIAMEGADAIMLHSADEYKLKAVNDILGDKCLMYASDFPHPESDWPHSVDNVLKWSNILGDAAMKNLMYANADRYLRMA